MNERADSDFLNVWQEIQRTFIFDENWIVSSLWLHLPDKREVSSWNHGDLSCTSEFP